MIFKCIYKKNKKLASVNIKVTTMNKSAAIFK